MSLSDIQRASCLVLLLIAVSAQADNPATLTARAEKGDAEAEYQLGQLFASGKGVAKDEARARQWFLKAAAQDHAKAQVSLGSIFAHGFGVAPDWAESIRWYRQAALQGDRIAQHNLGLDYNHGHGVGQDLVRAARWFRLGAEQGQPRCQYNLGLLYEEGKGVPQSDLEAWVLYSLAAKHPNQKHIFGEAKAKEVLERQDRLAKKLTAEQLAEGMRRVAALAALVEVNPRQFGAPGVSVGLTRGWYVWLKFNPETWEAEVKHEGRGEVDKVRVLPWATSYRYLNYGARPDVLLPGERVNLFFNPDERQRRGYLVHFQDEIGQMKGHGHYWQVKKVENGGRKFTAIGMAGDEPLDGKESVFVLGAGCQIWAGGKQVNEPQLQAGDKRYMTWCYRDGRRNVALLADDVSLEAIKKQEAERLNREVAGEGIAGRVEDVDKRQVHFLAFGTYWSQAGRLKEGQPVRLTLTGRGFHPSGSTVNAKVTFRKNRGQYGSGVTDMLLQLASDEDGKQVNGWPEGGVVRLLEGGS